MWSCRLFSGRELRLGPLPGVMAILNVTPDSFSDGGRFAGVDEAVEEGIRWADLGVALVDVGGESTRPQGRTYGAGAREVPLEEELRRVVPVIEGLRSARPSLPISVDTRKTGVAAAALDAGADMVNVVTGLTPDPGLLSLIAERGAAIVLNHCRGTPETTFEVSRFSDVVPEVTADLAAALGRAVGSGIAANRVLLDPGLGFGKSPGQCFALLASLDRLAPDGVPIVVGASRKAFLGSLGSRPVSDRLPESLGAVAAALGSAGTRPLLVRVHDVEETVRFLSILAASLPQ